jgi:hypothetical protein
MGAKTEGRDEKECAGTEKTTEKPDKKPNVPFFCTENYRKIPNLIGKIPPVRKQLAIAP